MKALTELDIQIYHLYIAGKNDEKFSLPQKKYESIMDQTAYNLGRVDEMLEIVNPAEITLKTIYAKFKQASMTKI